MQSDATQPGLFEVSHDYESTGSKVRVVAIGSVGRRAVADIADRARANTDVTYVDTSASALAAMHGSDCVLLDVVMAREAVRPSEDSISNEIRQQVDTHMKDALADAECVVIVSSLASAIGSIAAPVIADLAKESGSVVISTAMMPLGFEPIRDQLRASDTLDRLRVASDTVIEVRRDGHKTLPAALRDERRQVASLVGCIARICTGDGSSNGSNTGDLWSALQSGPEAALGTGSGYGHSGAVEAANSSVEMLIAGTDPGHSIRSAVVVISGGPELTTSCAATAVETVERGLGPDVDLRIVFRRSRLLAGKVDVSIIGSLLPARRLLKLAPDPELDVTSVRNETSVPLLSLA